MILARLPQRHLMRKTLIVICIIFIAQETATQQISIFSTYFEVQETNSTG